MLDAPVVTDEVPEGYEVAIFGLGCFWGAEEIYWQVPGVWSTSVGYAGGIDAAPVVRGGLLAAAPATPRPSGWSSTRPVVSYADLVKTFFEVHDPTQGMRQGNDVGTQYRSAIYWTTPEQEQTAARADQGLRRRAAPAADSATSPPRSSRPSETPYYYAEDHHQQYLAKNPYGYRCHANTGVPFPKDA